jgi:FemAB-related protein (PEP-CTERM system-associated)
MTGGATRAVATAGLRVRPFEQTDAARWEAFVAECPEATFFHRIGWRRVIEQGLGHRCHYLLAERDDRIEAVLPLAQVRSRLFGHQLVSTPCCVYGGVAARDASARQALLHAAVAEAERLRVDSLELRNRAPVGEGWPTKELYVTFRREISANDDDNLKAIPRKQRAMVRKGIAAGLGSRLIDDPDLFFRIYAESVRNLGTPVFPRRFFRVLCEEFRADAEIAVIAAPDGEDIAAVMSFYFRDEVLPYYGGSRPRARELKGNDFMYWDLMSRAAGRGARVFDYGRSKVGTGPYDFKRNWGFTPEALHYQYHLVRADSVPEVNPTNPRYHYFIEAWKRLPLPIANAVGPLLARNLG